MSIKWPAAAILLTLLHVTSAAAACTAEVAGQPVDGMIERAGSADKLLYLSKGQLEDNMNWFAAMEVVLRDPKLPRRPEVLDLYRQGLRSHKAEARLTQALECRLGRPYSTPPKPKSVAQVEASMPKRYEGPTLSAEDVTTLLNTLSNAMSQSAPSATGSGGGGRGCSGMVCY